LRFNKKVDIDEMMYDKLKLSNALVCLYL